MSNYLCEDCRYNNNGWCKQKQMNGLKKKNIQKCDCFEVPEVNDNPLDLLIRLEQCAKDKDGQPLVCYGCSHSAAFMRYSGSAGDIVEGTDFPGKPSGERPCFFCIRNTEREQWQEDYLAKSGSRLEVWYDGTSPVNVPMDCYHSVDMLRQIEGWEEIKY